MVVVTPSLPIKSIKDYFQENLNVAAQYRDWATGGDVADLDQLPRGEGAIVRRGLKKVAVYRDENGKLHEFSATCPHLGAVVRWNGQEKSWDCPAHGSRFTCDGHVVNGPANVDLESLPSDVSSEK